jgi:xylan 1,4-beta-xylosidase
VDPGLRPDPATGNPGRTYMWYPDAVLEFGFGLHYTTFDLSWDKAPEASYDIGSIIRAAQGTTVESSTFITVGVKVTNTGPMWSDYVALAFVNTSDAGPPPYPRKSLAGYTRVFNISEGSTTLAEITIPVGAVARADAAGNITVFPGTYTLAIDWDAQIPVEFTLTGSSVVIESLPKPGLPVNPAIVAKSHLGCFADDGDAKILSGADLDLGNANSAAACSVACQRAGYTYAGTEDAA